MTSTSIRHIVILGGGSAGWLTAGVIAAEHRAGSGDGLRVTVIESPDVPPIGVGEGTWPTMRDTLRKIGVSEAAFLRECDASFKQGSRFNRWVTGFEADYYFHPFVLPQGYGDADLAARWQARHPGVPFADLVLAVIRRTRAGRSPFAPDKQHLHHRLLEIGHSHRRAVLLMWLWAGLVAFGGVLASLYAGRVTAVVLAVWVTLTVVLTFVVPRVQTPHAHT